MAKKYNVGAKELETLWEDVRELSLGTTNQIERLDSPPSPVEFLRNFVTPNKPCIISNAIDHWPALSLWSSDDYLRQALGSTKVSVHLTPNGLADSLVPHPNDPSSHCFVSSHVEHMPFRDAFHLISNPEKNENLVAYAQQQNDCFRTEYGALAPDCEGHIDWATEALGSLPEAVNLWIGNNLSETSFHKDHYENLYAVVTGNFSLKLEDPVRHVPWCSVNPYTSKGTDIKEMEEFPLFFNGPKPFECTVKAGEMLYLPSMWFHYVKQSRRTIAVNYWYDMQFDIKYAYFNFLQSIHNPR